MEMIKDGKDANEALEAAKGNYGRFNDEMCIRDRLYYLHVYQR